MKPRTGCLALGCVFAVLASAAAQAPVHDPLARPRAKARAENQRVLLWLTGGDEATGEALNAELTDYDRLGKLVRYEYRLAALPGASSAGSVLRKQLRLGEAVLPVLAVLDTEDKLLGTLDAAGIAEGQLRAFLDKHTAPALDARKVLAAGIAAAKRDKRHVLVYLSAPW